MSHKVFSKIVQIYNNVRIRNPALPAILFQFVFDTFETFKQLRTKVDSLPGPVKQIWKQYVNDKIKMYHEDITFLSGFKTGTEVGNWLRFLNKKFVFLAV